MEIARRRYTRRMVRMRTPADNGAKLNRLLVKTIICGAAFIAVTLYRNSGNDMKVVGHIVSGDNETFSYREVMERIGRAVSEENGLSQLARELSQEVFEPVWKTEEPLPVTAEPAAAQPRDPVTDEPVAETGSSVKIPDNPEPDSVPKEDETSFGTLSASVPSFEYANLVFNPLELTDTTDPGPFEIPLPDNVVGDEVALGFKHTTPLKGNVTSPFRYRVHPVDGETKFHYGIDIAANKGSAICAFAAGTVTEAGYNSAYGNYVKILHSDGYTTLYGHCSRFYVGKGDKVTLSQKIAAVGMTGLATGYHLHFELRNGSKFYDPTYYINP